LQKEITSAETENCGNYSGNETFSPRVIIESVTSYPKDSLVNSLFDRVTELENEVKNQKKLLEKEKMLKDHVTNELENLKESFSKYFEKDQLDFMSRKKVIWSNKTVQKGTMLRYKLGKKFYDEVFRKEYAPYWPSSTTCGNRIKDFKLVPGTLEFNVNILGLKIEKLPIENHVIGIIFDEKAILPSYQKDFGINEYCGKATLCPSALVVKKEGEEPLAKHSLVALGVCSPIREKELIGLHYTAGSTDGEAMKKFIFDMIIYVENHTKIKVQWIGMDLSPTNQSMLKACGISLKKDNTTFKIQHPNRPNDWLYIFSDMAHDEKNVISRLRRKDIELDQKFVDQFELSSSTVSFEHVKNIFQLQQEMDLKPAKRIKQEHINPSQFEKMRQHIATDVLSADVSSTIDFLENLSTNASTNNATAWFLKVLLIFHNIVFDKEGWTVDSQKYEDAKEYLIWMAEEFFPNLKDCNNLKCIPGVIMSIRSLLAVADENFKNGHKKFIPAHYLNDAIENVFSLVNDIITKPTAKSIADALRIISLRQFQFNPIKGNCGWDDVEPISIDFIGELKLFIQNQDINTDKTPNDQSESDEIPDVAINDEVTMTSLFGEPLERNIFYCEVSKMFNQIFDCFKCQKCQEILVDSDGLSTAASDLFDMRNHIEASSYGTAQLKNRPSSDLMTFCLRLEYIYREIAKSVPVDRKSFKKSFMMNAARVFFPNQHCSETTEKITTHFLDQRRHLTLHRHLPHKALKNAARDLI
jgi:hypothetical protein